MCGGSFCCQHDEQSAADIQWEEPGVRVVSWCEGQHSPGACPTAQIPHHFQYPATHFRRKASLELSGLEHFMYNCKVLSKRFEKQRFLQENSCQQNFVGYTYNDTQYVCVCVCVCGIHLFYNLPRVVQYLASRSLGNTAPDVADKPPLHLQLAQS